MACTLLRRASGQRSVMSKIFSPSIICVKALPPTAVWMTFCTSATLTPQRLALLAIDGEFQVRLSHDAEDAHVLDARDAWPGSSSILFGQLVPVRRGPARRS